MKLRDYVIKLEHSQAQREPLRQAMEEADERFQQALTAYSEIGSGESSCIYSVVRIEDILIKIMMFVAEPVKEFITLEKIDHGELSAWEARYLFQKADVLEKLCRIDDLISDFKQGKIDWPWDAISSDEFYQYPSSCEELDPA